jgi:hypothetical protein
MNEKKEIECLTGQVLEHKVDELFQGVLAQVFGHALYRHQLPVLVSHQAVFAEDIVVLGRYCGGYENATGGVFE